MSKFELLSFPDAQELAASAADQWLQALEIASQNRTPYWAALSGGRIARHFFASVAAQARGRIGVFQSVHFCWSDERCVPPNDPESNFAIARDVLLKPLGIAEARIHRIRGELPPDVAGAEASAELRQLVPASDLGQPLLDLVFLGMGEDGHVASLFPGEPEALTNDPAVYRPVVASKPPPHRITMGYRALAAARQVWVLASGPGKEKALRDSLSSPAHTPLGRVLALRAQTRIFTDINFA